MSVRVVARIRPLLPKELDKDVIVRAESVENGKPATVVKIPNPRNEAEEFSFTFNGVYDQETTQEALFASEVSPYLKSLFQGLDVTIFAYGVTGTGKTHTMRGGMKLADRGVIPRLLSGVFRRGKKISKESEGNTTVQVALSYYEIYNDKVFDLLESPEKRTPTGLPLRAEASGKTVVVGLTERACVDLKDFEKLYIEANNNRVTAATKLNAHSSRSHAILRVKLTQITGNMIRESTASAIDLAGSEDNRRTDNDKERMVESAAINKSLFVLSQCIDAISRGDKRVPYRESKMTRILSLGQNNGITVMILNLAPMRSYHLDTLSSLNVSSRAKRIEVREIENEVVFKQVPRTNSNASGTGVQRQPLRPLANALNAHNVHNGNVAAKAADVAKPVKAFSVYTDKAKPTSSGSRTVVVSTGLTRSGSQKRPSEHEPLSRPSKLARPSNCSQSAPNLSTHDSVTVSASELEAIVEKKVCEILAAKTAAEKTIAQPETPGPPAISDAVQKRLEALERRIENEEWRDEHRSDGLRYLLVARQHKERGDDASALRAYEMALPYFPGQAKLVGKIERLRARLAVPNTFSAEKSDHHVRSAKKKERRRHRKAGSEDEESIYHDAEADVEENCAARPKNKVRKARSRSLMRAVLCEEEGSASPRTQKLLRIINSGDLVQIKSLVGFGAKKAQDLVDYVEHARADGDGEIQSLSKLRTIPGMGGRVVERAYAGLA